MAFSFRAGTNWYHDFPKLAQTAGFYFNAHTTRVRVDWNRISSIDIDRVIRERDFQTVDDNVNNVIDYGLESEYDVKILDPNFVKLFRLAQLAVEYLLYCKQYLDFTFAVLKDEFKLKLEENKELESKVKELKEEMKRMEEKYKEKSKVLDIKSDIHKCPHCPKTFVSASFANAHLVRRHSNLSNVFLSSSPAHEEYKAETEKLKDEIKSLKERLNQTERVIRNEPSNKNEISRKERLMSSMEDGDSAYEDQYRRYQEEINNLKTILFTEIRNIKRKESNLSNQENDNNNESIKQLVNHQEDEIQRLKNQMQDHLTSNANDFQTKLAKQEEYWKSKIEQLENQHRKDIDNLFIELKVTQESANHMKLEYEEKVSFLEKQSIDQSKLLSSQSEQLKNLSKGMLDSQKLKINESENKTSQTAEKESLTEDTMDSESSHNLRKSIRKILTQSDNRSPVHTKTSSSFTKLLSSRKEDERQKVKTREELARESNLSKYKERKPKNHRQTTKAGVKYSSLDESGKSETSDVSESETEIDEDSDEETSESSGSLTESTNDEATFSTEKEPIKRERRSSVISLDAIKEDMEEAFEKRLRDLGIDPDWNGIPVATFKQKIETIRHQQNILCRKYPKYEQIRKKLFEELVKRIPSAQKFPKKVELEKKSFLNKAVKNVKSKALKALNEFKLQKNQESSTSVISSKNSTPRESQSKRRFSLELLPKKPTHQDIQEIKTQATFESATKPKREEPTVKLRSSLNVEESVIIESPQPARPKLLQRSYQSIEEFMRDIEEPTIPKLDMTSSKITSTPSRNVKNILLDSYTFGNESDGQSAKQDAPWALASPKNNKSVLKSTSGVGSTVKKKVIFDLEKENSPDKESKSVNSFITGKQNEQKDLHDNAWNISSVQNEKVVVKERAESTENIQLKTSQSEKIAEISRRIQEKLAASRSQKPAGSVETMFTAGSPLKTFASTQQSPLREKPSSHVIEARPRISQTPQPAPRKQMFESKDSDLDTDIEDLLIN
ncbi:cilium assembly protein DZIP1 [Phymastichus coffea]|uniref:cilium assembly protein DZIP1 n=1 Tax=Phymastichus coffea TaxID=108790 RepID=UPI00273AC2A1|nr:cilium assembly protein DZIP1 [Phymastichus coffea]